MRVLLNLVVMSTLLVSAHSAVVAFGVHTPPLASDFFPDTTEIDFDADGVVDVAILQGGTNCISNEAAHRCSRGFLVDLSAAVEVHVAGREVTQIGLGQSIGSDIIGSDGSWAHLDFFNFIYSYGTSPDSYNFERGDASFAIPIRMLTAEGFRYGYMGVSQLTIERSIFTGLDQEVIHPHIDVVFLEQAVGNVVIVTSIPEPSGGLLTLLGVGVLALKSQWRTRRS